MAQHPRNPDELEDDFVNLSDYIGKTVVLVPTKADTVNTNQYGPREVIRAILYTRDRNKLVEKGEVTIFWKLLRNQLDGLWGEAVIGRLAPHNRTYGLDECSDYDQVEKLVEKLDPAF